MRFLCWSVLAALVAARAAGEVNFPLRDVPRAYETGSPSPLVAADVDRDGHVDVVAGSAILYGRGDGVFDAVPIVGAAFVADLNGDRLPDLIRQWLASVELQFNLGGRQFAAAVEIEARDLVLRAVHDLTGDGYPDLFMCRPDRPCTLFPNDGRGGFGSRLDSGVKASRIAAGDFDGDGDEDLAASDRSLTVALNDGKGRFTIHRNLGPPAEPVVADLDGNGRAEVIALREDGVTIYSDGSNERVLNLAASADHALVADLDGDGVNDLAISGAWDLFIYRNEGAGRFRLVQQIPAGGHAPAAGDADEDGAADLFVPAYRGVGVVRGTGLGTFRYPTPLPVPAHGWVIPFDLDGDGVDELWVGNGDIAWENEEGTYVFERDVTSGYVYREIGHFNVANGPGDDLVFTNYDLKLQVLSAESRGRWQSFEFDLPHIGYVKVVDDLSGDGFDDIVAFDSQGTLYVLAGNGSVHAIMPPVVFTPDSLGPRGYEVARTDADGDGASDLLVIVYASGGWHPDYRMWPWGYVALYRGRGDGTFHPAQFILRDTLVVESHIADRNGDGNVDFLLLTSSPPGRIDSYAGDGAGHFIQHNDPITPVPYKMFFSSFDVFDFDGDGFDDVLQDSTIHYGSASGFRESVRYMASAIGDKLVRRRGFLLPVLMGSRRGGLVINTLTSATRAPGRELRDVKR